jgi:hypothetical protein
MGCCSRRFVPVRDDEKGPADIHEKIRAGMLNEKSGMNKSLIDCSHRVPQGTYVEDEEAGYDLFSTVSKAGNWPIV